MAVKKILFLLGFVAAASLAYARASLWDARELPPDYDWLERRKIRVIDDSENEVDAKFDDICKTDECQKFANSFLGSMDNSADPCENFYQFTCGNWDASNPIEPSAVSSSSLRNYQTLVDQQISELLLRKMDRGDILPVKQAKKWYRACMNTAELERIGIDQIESIVTEAGGWPIAMRASDWNYEDHRWQDVESYYARLTGHNAFYEVAAVGPSDDAPKGAIVLEPSEVLEKRGLLMQSPLSYFAFLKKAIQLISERSENPLIKETYVKEAVELVTFEAELLQLKIDNAHEVKDQKDIFTMPYQEFIDRFERNTTKISEVRIDWKSGIQGLFDLLDVKVHPSSTVIILNIGYFTGLKEILEKTSPRTIVNYVHWNFIAKALSYTTESMRDEIFKLSSNFRKYGVTTRPPRSMECLKEMDIKYAAAYLFTEKYFPKSTENRAREMLENLRNGMMDNIDNSNWLGETSKSLIKEKLKAMSSTIGAPEWHINATAVAHYYKGLTINSQHLDNVLSYMRFDRKKKMISYAKPGEELPSILTAPTVVNANYNELINSLNVPTAMFSWPLLAPGLPDYVNYGQVGFAIGHEMGHGFDISGVRYGKDGNATHLSEDTLNNYVERAQCFVDQYNRYYGDSQSDRGAQTVRENMADTTGLHTSFQAYRYLNEKKLWNEPKLPGLEKFTDDQLFFIAFGNYGCRSLRPAYEKAVNGVNDPHSPAKLRVNGVLSNTKGFAEAFDCPKGSAMNPNEKCNIWEAPNLSPTVIQTKRITGKRRHSIGQRMN